MGKKKVVPTLSTNLDDTEETHSSEVVKGSGTTGATSDSELQQVSSS